MAKDWRRSSVVRGEATLSYVVRAGGAPAVLLIPGSFSDVHQWDHVVGCLPRDLHLVLTEVRGHGGSWPPPVDGSIEQFAADTLAIADAENLERFCIGGHSLGGMIAKEFARRWESRVAGVISLEGWTHWRAAGAFEGSTYITLTPEQERRRLDIVAHATGRWTDEQRGEFVKIWRKWERGEEFMRQTPLPVLEMYGDRGRPRPSREQLCVPDRPNIAFRWLSGASHDLPLERPQEVAAAMAEFLQRNGR